MKDKQIQKAAPRKPRQERAQHKIELILEAAIRLLGKGGLAALTTNAVAETAGVSIGTLYQYFANKDAILDALAARETAGLSERVLRAVQEPEPMAPAERIRHIIRAVSASYGGRTQVHRIVTAHSLARGSGHLKPLLQQLVTLLADADRPGISPALFSPADAFVLTNAFVGVMRARIQGEDVPPAGEIEAALVRLMVNFTSAPAIET
jgi:AcrR family transcriptional regulator